MGESEGKARRRIEELALSTKKHNGYYPDHSEGRALGNLSPSA
jgi:hypothetical protein